MRRSTLRYGIIGGMLGLAVAGTSTVNAADSKWYDTVAIGGHVQGSYVGALGKDTPDVNQLRGFDANNGFNLNQAQVRIAKPLAEDGYGFGIKLLAGHDAGLIHSVGGGTSNDFDLEEAYATMAIPRVKNLSMTGGKFVTACGVEVIESPVNMAIEPGLLFFWGMPFTHTGAKLNYALGDKVTLMGGLANGWDLVTDNNSGKTMIWQIATTPLKAVTANLSGSYGPELLTDNISKRTHLDFVLGYTGIDKLTLNAEYLWGQDTNVGGVADSATTPWSGAGLWASFAMSDFLNPGIRFEVFNDEGGAGRLTPAAPFPTSAVATGTRQTAKEISLVNKFVLTKATFIRAEYRHDWSNEATYRRDDGTGVTNQNTISLDWVVTF